MQGYIAKINVRRNIHPPVTRTIVHKPGFTENATAFLKTGLDQGFPKSGFAR